ncbi:DNA-methyltransferase [Longimycelium tulufanense]|uniref:DNA-methyltransferase n=1 Tax=Longimycelium tulufanense TaxID=907463 RepID=UPI001E4A0C5C|nr:site-specific DNA-methyltransferase [Longimycelium tulufanense]
MPTVDMRHGEALSVLSTLDAASVDAVITDPPYSSGGMVRGDRTAGVHAKYVRRDSRSGNRLAAFGGDNRDQRSFAYWSALWLSEALRVTTPGGVLAVFTDWRQLPTTTDAIQAGGWVWRGIVPWHKPNGRRCQGRFANNCEYIVWGTCGPRPLNIVPHAPDGFFQINTPRQREHITQKPLELMRHLVTITPAGGLILDPFAGTGTTGVAAVLEGRSFLGVEASDHFHTIATRRLAEATELIDQRGEQPTLTP